MDAQKVKSLLQSKCWCVLGSGRNMTVQHGGPTPSVNIKCSSKVTKTLLVSVSHAYTLMTTQLQILSIRYFIYYSTSLAIDVLYTGLCFTFPV